ncbi:MAG TPA: aminopeptidase N C-terminal domain-containing protein, partial [Alphaproteobacteria bacterium]
QWDAGQTLMMHAFDRGLKAAVTPNTPMPDETSLVDALRNMINNLKSTKRALLAHMLTLPDDSIIAAAHQPTNPSAIHAVRNALESAIAFGLKDEWTSLYKDNAPTSPDFSLEPDAVARRALRNIALFYLTKAMPAEGFGLAKSQYEHATNMTDRLGAIKAVIETSDPLRDDFLKDFYGRFQQHPLVVDKWFMVQASAARPTIVHDIKALMEHPAFGIKNPNRVRALIGAFAMRNMAGFHHPSGDGYKLVADVVIQLNTINPQVGARLLMPMRQWKTFTPELADKMKAELTRILHSGDLSPDIFEVVSKTLNG